MSTTKMYQELIINIYIVLQKCQVSYNEQSVPNEEPLKS